MHKYYYGKNSHSVTNCEAVTPFRLCTKIQIYKSKGIHYSDYAFYCLIHKQMHLLQEQIIIYIKNTCQFTLNEMSHTY